MRVCAIVMQKNEVPLLKTWYTYHARLLGARNLYILDNQSTDERTLRLLDAAEAAGVNVLRGFENFELKGVYVSKLIADLKEAYDVFFPLDCDECAGVLEGGTFRSDRASLLAELESAIEGPTFLRVSKSIWNVPYTAQGYRCAFMKIVVAGPMTIQLDLGFHLYDWVTRAPTVDPALIRPSNLAYLHFHNRPFPELLRSARQKLSNRVAAFDRETLTAYQGAGKHLARYFTMSELDYMEGLEEPTVELGPHFAGLGLAVPFSKG
jgi:hypothetical protein